MKKKKRKKKTSFISKTAMTVLTIILIILFFCIMSMVEKIQGTARVVNYAGLVRGKTQRIIKLEDAGEPQDTMIADINAYIDGLQNGSSELDLVRLDDRDFQDKMTELASYFEELKAEILLVREKGYENTAIIEKRRGDGPCGSVFAENGVFAEEAGAGGSRRYHRSGVCHRHGADQGRPLCGDEPYSAEESLSR